MLHPIYAVIEPVQPESSWTKMETGLGGANLSLVLSCLLEGGEVKKMGWRRILVLAGFLMLMPGGVSASFYCGSEIVDVGDTSVEVLKKCGEPDFRELLGFTGNGGHLKIERWYYDLGPNRLMRILLLEGAVLTDIDKGDYGGDW